MPLTPVVGFFLVCSALCAVLVQLDPSGLVWSYLLFSPPGVFVDPHDLVYQDQYWRLFTPMFLHVGLLHIVMNGLLLWILGSAVEVRRGGSVILLCLLLLCGLGSNVAQHLQDAGPFGGLSGALFGLVGYIMFSNRYFMRPPIEVPSALLWMLVITMLIGFTGLLNFVIGGRVANAAHLGGFVTGVLIAVVVMAYRTITGRLGRENAS